MQMNIDDIKISDQFLDSHPSQEKMERFEKYWLRTNHQDKSIILDKNGYLVDGYIRYLIMKRNGAKTIRTVYKGQPGALIKGVHINYDGIGGECQELKDGENSSIICRLVTQYYVLRKKV